MNCSMPGFSVHHYLPEFAQIHVHWVSDTIRPTHPLSSPSPLALKFSQHQGLFQWFSTLSQATKVMELQLQHQSFQYIDSGLISLRIDGFDLLAVHETLKSLLQHHRSKTSILPLSAFFTVRLSHPLEGANFTEMMQYVKKNKGSWKILIS